MLIGIGGTKSVCKWLNTVGNEKVQKPYSLHTEFSHVSGHD